LDLNILEHNHFKLYILTEDKITFETELLRNGIQFYSNSDEQIDSTFSIRYYLKDEDRQIIDQIIIDNEISSGTESTGLSRFEFNRKPLRLFILIAILVTIIFSITIYLF